MFDTLQSVKEGDTKPEEAIDCFQASAENALPVFFVKQVQMVLASGYNPLTWEYYGSGSPPDLRVYQNMLPRESPLFTKWLQQYLQPKQP